MTEERPKNFCPSCGYPDFAGHASDCASNPEGLQKKDKEPERVDQEIVQQELVDSYEYNFYGPKVGVADIIDKKTGQSVHAEVRVSEDKGLTFRICTPDGNELGYTSLEELSVEDTVELEAKNPYDPKLYYGNNLSTKGQSKVYVDEMVAGAKSQYKGIGQRLHEIAVERSFQIGAEGRVQLMIGGIGGMAERNPGTSGGFHESLGFLGQDVYNADGSLHHSGQMINQKIAEGTWEVAQIQKSIGEQFLAKGEKNKAERFWPPQNAIHSNERFWPEEKPYMYLPPEAINRERGRMKEQPLLLANKATIKALLDKHNQLARERYQNRKA